MQFSNQKRVFFCFILIALFEDLVKSTNLTESNITRPSELSENFKQHTNTSKKLPKDVCSENVKYCTRKDEIEFGYCYCDAKCRVFNDCCHDYNGTGADIATTDVTSQQCFPSVYTHDKFIHDEQFRLGFYAIDKCPLEYQHKSINHKCREDDIINNGIFVVANKHLVFKNRYCAICNNIFDYNFFNLTFFNFKTDFQIDEFSELTRREKLESLLNNADYHFSAPGDINLRYCVPNLAKVSKPYCEDYIHPVQVKGNNTIYRNYHCLPEDTVIDRNEVACLKEGRWFRFVPIYSMSVLFSFEKNENECYNADCELYSNIEETHQIYWYSTKNLTSDVVRKLLPLACWFFKGNEYETRNDNFYQIDSTKRIIRMYLRLTFIKRSYISHIRSMMAEMTNRKVTVHIEKSSRQIQRVDLQSFIPIPLDNFTFSNLEWFGLLDFRKPTKLLLENYDIYVNDNSVDFGCSSLSVFLLFVNESAFVRSTTCNRAELIDRKIIQKVLTYVSFSVSTIALLTLIILQRKFSLINNLSSSNIENMAIALLASNLLFMFGIGVENLYNLCYIIGVCLHYLWLSVFSFTTVSVIYIARTLTKLKTNNYLNDGLPTLQRIKLTLVGWTIPLIFVIPTIFLDKFGPSSLSANYGKNACFPDAYPINIIFFTGPVLFSLAFNFICLCYLICSVCKVRLATANIRKMNPYMDMMMYFRIVIISGIPWLSVLFFILTGSESSEIFFIVLCGFHGLFMAIVVLTSSKVRSLLRPKHKTITEAINSPVTSKF